MNRKQNSLMRFSRTERLAQLSEQEIVIERKKREIQAKLEAQKKKQAEEAFRKLESSKETKNNRLEFSKKSSGSGAEYEKNSSKEKPIEQVKENLTNAFSNDGSFLDQFKKLSQTGLSPNYVNMQTLAMAKKMEGDFQKVKDTKEEITNKQAHDIERDKKDCKPRSNNNESFFVKEPLDSKIQLQVPPPGVIQLIPQHQSVSGMSYPADNLVPETSLQPALVPEFQSAAKTPPLAFHSESAQINYSQANLPGAVHPTQAVQSSPLCPVFNSKNSDDLSSEKDHNHISSTTLSSVQPPLSISPKTILPPSTVQVQNLPPPSVTPNELPKVRSESISMTLKSNAVKKLEAIPNPLEVDQTPSPTPPTEKQFSFKEKSLNTLNFSTSAVLENVASHNKESSTISSAFYNKDEDEESYKHLDENFHHWAELVAQFGDEFEESLRTRKENDPSVRFLLDKNSKDYLSYRKLVLKYRRGLNLSEGGTSNKLRISGGDTSDTKDLLDSETMPSIRQQEAKIHSKSLRIQADVETSLLNNETPESSSKECSLLSYQNQLQTKDKFGETSGENSKDGTHNSEEMKTEERRKRKRKSRWGDAVPTTSAPTSGNLNLQPPGKLPAPKSALLSQLTRSDPGLIQYARQTFGSTNLSEEDWKKAEDHYKINLLYQDMVKKRAEVEKLERQGKFKYEYDSDEDTEGGTWEHKLRKQEMQATQLWAEELTRQAAGKHHIGDFLPPEELERFMEKYNAVKEGREPDLSDYKEYKLKQDNVGYRLLQKMGWNEGQGLGQDGTGITNPVNKATTRHENQGLGIDRPDGLAPGDDEYDAYRKRMMLAYRFRPNPLNNPRRPYY